MNKAAEQVETPEEEKPVLTPEEQAAIESEGGPDDYTGTPVVTEPEQGELELAAIKDGKTDEEIAAAKEQDQINATNKEADEGDDDEAKQAAAALVERAKAAGLEETATEEEIVAAEKQKVEDEAKDPFVKIETELAKPEGKEDLKEFTEREKAYFFQMRRDRKSRQQAEADKDAALFRESKLKKELENKKPVEEDDPLKGKDDADFLTVAEAKEILAKAAAKKTPAADDDQEPQTDPATKQYLVMADNEARAAHPEDYDSVMELTAEIIGTNPKYVEEVNNAVAAGKNPAEISYNLIKSDPEFAKLFPAAQVRWTAHEKLKNASENKPDKPEEEKTPEEKAEEKKQADLAEQKAKIAKDAQAKLEKNKLKTKTTGNLNTSLQDNTGAELSAQQIADMSDLEFAKLPKPTRDKYMRLYG